MNRTITGLCTALLLVPALVMSHDFVEGVHFQRIGEAPSHEPGSPIEVVEVFWYGCPACFQWEPWTERWLQTRPTDVEYSRVGAVLNPGWRVHARAYYTAEVLGVVDRVHKPIFQAIHMQRNPLNDPAAIARLFSDRAGVSREDFQRAWDSFGVETRLRRGDQFTRRMRVMGTPTMVVGGVYTFTPTSVGNWQEAVELLDFLIEQVRGAPSVPIDPAMAQAAPAQDAPARADAPPAPASADSQPGTMEPVREEAGIPVWLYWVAGLGIAAVIGMVAVRAKS